MIGKGRRTITKEEVLAYISESEILYNYLHISKVPCRINSPLRRDRKPSVGIFSPDGVTIRYVDFATGDRGTLFTLLSKMWNLNYTDTLYKIYNDVSVDNKNKELKITRSNICSNITKLGHNPTTIEVKTRNWRDYDIEYWKSYGVSIDWLKYANVYPITHKILHKENKTYTFAANKYAYAFAEFKEGNRTFKIYQPYSKEFKWLNNHDSSVISLWTKVPKSGDKICICSSLKDALCLWSNTGIPAIAVQGEGYTISQTAIKELKKRFKNIYILFDNDAPGLKDGKSLAKATGFQNIVLPQFEGGKDISDFYKCCRDKKIFINTIINLFK